MCSVSIIPHITLVNRTVLRRVVGNTHRVADPLNALTTQWRALPAQRYAVVIILTSLFGAFPSREPFFVTAPRSTTPPPRPALIDNRLVTPSEPSQ